MQRRDADSLDCLAMLGGRVADVLLESPAGVLGGGALHVAIAGDLGDHRGGGDRGAGAIAFDHGPVRHAALAQRETIDKAGSGSIGLQTFERVGERFDVGHVQTALVDTASAAHHDTDPLGSAQHAGKELGPLLGVHLLGVVQAGEGAAVGMGKRLVVNQHRRRDQRAGEATAPGLVGAGNPAAVEAAVEGEEAPCAR